MNNQQRAALIFGALQNYISCRTDLKRFYRYELMLAIQDTFEKTALQPYVSRAQYRCCPFSNEESLHVNYEAAIHLVVLIGSADELAPQHLFYNWWCHDVSNI
ncbi:hypothetical protein [Pseudomonas fontis]|uniref:Uncharacterized protein n=1 Tax=Pseudomonas fontis TaxID=2942633 RepID=A0ABT5NSE5_9PSED|nr:hypothetical protein [Pseudomonas fontis]MDD0974824.1 hypothetical protein [Pseudomonas fontis]MDD0991089.1 hypothetical protein [Pseudomonas fontis]